MPNVDSLVKHIRHSNVTFIQNRVPIVWGGPGIFNAEIELIKTAKKNGTYDYYHFITGQDLPLKSVEYINAFLEKNLYNNKSGNLATNYIIANVPDEIFRPRIEQYNFFVKHYRDDNPIKRGFYRGTNKLIRLLQKMFHVNRLKGMDLELYFGSSWWSLTDEFINYLLINERKLKALFDEYTFAADEFAVQTLFENSPFKYSKFNPVCSNIDGNLRLIDFERGNGQGSPHVFSYEDLQLVKKTENLWGRKFDLQYDSKIIDEVLRQINKGNVGG